MRIVGIVKSEPELGFEQLSRNANLKARHVPCDLIIPAPSHFGRIRIRRVDIQRLVEAHPLVTRPVHVPRLVVQLRREGLGWRVIGRAPRSGHHAQLRHPEDAAVKVRAGRIYDIPPLVHRPSARPARVEPRQQLRGGTRNVVDRLELNPLDKRFKLDLIFVSLLQKKHVLTRLGDYNPLVTDVENRPPEVARRERRRQLVVAVLQSGADHLVDVLGPSLGLSRTVAVPPTGIPVLIVENAVAVIVKRIDVSVDRLDLV